MLIENIDISQRKNHSYPVKLHEVCHGTFSKFTSALVQDVSTVPIRPKMNHIKEPEKITWSLSSDIFCHILRKLGIDSAIVNTKVENPSIIFRTLELGSKASKPPTLALKMQRIINKICDMVLSMHSQFRMVARKPIYCNKNPEDIY